MTDYELMYKADNERQSWSCWRLSIFLTLALSTAALVFLIWDTAYETANVQYPPLLYTAKLPDWYKQRTHLLANNVHNISHDFRLMRYQETHNKAIELTTYSTYVVPNTALYHNQHAHVAGHAGPPLSAGKTTNFRLVCYYTLADSTDNNLNLRDVNATLCTHINIGFADIQNSTLVLSKELVQALKVEAPRLVSQNPNLKLLLWVGGAGDTGGFPAMVKNHVARKIFIQSLKQALHQYSLDGVDLDWEFPSAYNKERQHFSQLLYEIRQEYKRERRNYLLSVAVAAPEGIAYFAYDVGEINKYADYVNLMSYDYHFYSHGTPFTGLNAPLYARANEHSLLATLNINYSVNWWLTQGLERQKLVVGLPMYGHSFKLVNPFNNGIGAPAENYGQCGREGFTTYSEICWFNTHNIQITSVYDNATCSPFLSCGNEWISYENELSIACKTHYVRSMQLGGIMAFSLNTDDNLHYCNAKNLDKKFPLIETAKKCLFGSIN